MEELQLAAFQIISEVGTAKSYIMEALGFAREKKLEEAKETLKKAEEHLKEGHKGHFDLVQKEARGEKLEFSILFMHAEDQLLTTATLKDVVTEMINMYTMIHEK
ncbi:MULTISPECIES: PTS lactose/cellobiose transporter subunit IIA [Clostridium]|jgi:PTS system cellobiose-specific IIA component|uniref:Oligo-beta-mannoside-specific phosphotransferase enzyme IIA component n=3 Tax=Clostridium intestinale TaxID=36845 RepID=U2NJ31_9CLOT|nr:MULTISPECIES: PTS lactose/cellobiose transporter subunit IIA [Clostridium]ERK28876.1 Oligo-beta-mannoside-specific phosphotransferase enzyme IIA component [Clostridium intestinale URNW]QLY80226.1 PTS lactose/cellobiose transporter subunit IIA [Clostridium intestinale]SHI94642.1 PTS system, cellobiose-specific IIA component [Clostridium intestinale DSM 6191]